MDVVASSCRGIPSTPRYSFRLRRNRRRRKGEGGGSEKTRPNATHEHSRAFPASQHKSNSQHVHQRSETRTGRGSARTTRGEGRRRTSFSSSLRCLRSYSSAAASVPKRSASDMYDRLSSDGNSGLRLPSNRLCPPRRYSNRIFSKASLSFAARRSSRVRGATLWNAGSGSGSFP